MIGPERACVFPLGVNRSVTFFNFYPTILARRHTRSLIGFLEPRNDPGRFGPMAVIRLIVIGQGAVKRILPGREFHRSIIIAAMRGIRIIESAVAARPIMVP